MNHDELVDSAKEVLDHNDRGQHTVPAEGLYPHQWLWDSCFIAIGQRHYDVVRAKQEILSLFRGQWANGMLPNMIMTSGSKGTVRHKPEMWRSNASPYSPDNVATSGITQPPVVAEAVIRIGDKLSKTERRTWYQHVYPGLLAYHKWLYEERDPHNEGLVLQLHPWETGLDNTPPWMDELHQHQLPFWIRAVRALNLDHVITLFRRDRRFALPGERLSTIDALTFYSIQRRLRRKGYDTQRALRHSILSIEDLTFNCILIRNNKHLRAIAKIVGRDLPDDLTTHMKKTEEALEQLWDAYSNQYYSRNFTTHKLIKVPSIATLMPLYAGTITKERAKQLVELIENHHQFGAKFPVPTVPLSSDWFKETVYWQGPTWINTNWLIVDGLRRYKYDKLADHIVDQTLKLVSEHGYREYFSPVNGKPAGAHNFSWSAALAIDFVES